MVVLSDFFDTQDDFGSLRFLLYRGFTPALVQVLAEDDLTPSIDNVREIVDVEDPSVPPIVVDPQAVAAYRERLSSHMARLQQFCRANGLVWTQVSSNQPLSAAVGDLLRSGLLGLHG